MNHEKPTTTALALGSTVAFLYSLCALAFAIFPSATAGFIRSISHGVNLQALEIGATPFSFGDFVIGLICVTTYSLIAGLIYGWIRNAFHLREKDYARPVQKTSAAHA